MKTMNNQIVDNVNNGKVINRIYNSWCKIKSEAAHKNWEKEAGTIRFGTYKDDSVFDVINTFNPTFPNEIIKRDFLNELMNAYLCNSIHKFNLFL